MSTRNDKLKEILTATINEINNIEDNGVNNISITIYCSDKLMDADSEVKNTKILTYQDISLPVETRHTVTLIFSNHKSAPINDVQDELPIESPGTKRNMFSWFKTMLNSR